MPEKEDKKAKISKSPAALREEAILKFWEENKIFEKSLQIRKNSPLFSFYDGPPFATGTPHYGHIVASAMKDIVPRYWTMRGYYVERKWGWDCHGLPIENIAEKELGITRKKEIVKMGVEKFNEFCRSKVLKYTEEWKKTIKRLGRWVDMDNAYRTMDRDFMESVWWVFKELWDRGFIYEGYRVIHICTRCETTLSQSEVSEGYRMVKDLAVIAKFPIADQKFIDKYCQGTPTSFIAWTTTPWSLPTTMALAIGADFTYAVVRFGEDQIICAKDRLPYVAAKKPELKYEIISELKGKEMEHISYEHPFGKLYRNHPKVKDNSNVYKTHITDYVSTEGGTGLVTINGAFGDIDMEASKKIGLPVVVNVRMDGTFTEEMGEFTGMSVKPIENREKTDVEILKYLSRNNYLFAKEKYSHSYPHCWRCDTPLINYATSSWFVNVLKIKPRALELAKEINWSPEHIKEGRFGIWLLEARDWSISRQRFWASVIPIWKCSKCGEIKVIGSAKELEELSGQKVTDLHKHIIDKITFKCVKCARSTSPGQDGIMRRVPDVLDTWFDSGSMPYAQMHYPFENKEKFEKVFPANFIAEGADQTRAWFYYLHIISSIIKDSIAYKNVIVNGIVLSEDGRKMSKRLQNYPDPALMFDKYGADALRFYLASSPVMAADTINFKESDVRELAQGMLRMLWNSYLFFKTYGSIKAYNLQSITHKLDLLDKWIISELNVLIKQVNESMEKYELNRAAKLFPKFVDNFSNWYVRRSRSRFQKLEGDKDRLAAEKTMKNVLIALSKAMAPFAPYMTEEIYKNLTGEESVHLADFPESDKKLIDVKLNEEMNLVRGIVTLGLAARAKAKIKVRQPIASLKFKISARGGSAAGGKFKVELLDLVKDELNVKKIIAVNEIKEQKNWVTETNDKITVALDINITAELKEEGIARDIVRHIQTMRKDLGLTKENTIEIFYEQNPTIDKLLKKWSKYIKTKTLAKDIARWNKEEKNILEKDLAVDGQHFKFGIKKIK